jgi:anti-sigma regulatory factor (Ser/Thr protein kinase)
MREISLHILDIAENSVSAGATRIQIQVHENHGSDLMDIVIKDNGKGMDAETVAQVVDPFYTSRTTRKVGLGIPLLKAAAEACDGALTIQSSPGIGTIIEVYFKFTHIDRMPLGDLASTFVALLVAYPEIDWSFDFTITRYISDTPTRSFLFENKPFRKALDGCSYSEPIILSYIRDLFENGIRDVESPLELQNIIS